MRYCVLCKQVNVHCSDIKIKTKPVILVPAYKQELSSAVTIGFLLKIRK